MTTVSHSDDMLGFDGLAEKFPDLNVGDILVKIPHTDDYRWKESDVWAYLSTVCECSIWEWCEADHAEDQTDDDRKYHHKKVSVWEISVVFSVYEGNPRMLWLPDFEEWTFTPDEIDDVRRLAETFKTIHEMYGTFLQEVSA